MAVVYDGQVRMAYMAIVASFSVNGVARLHTEIPQLGEIAKLGNGTNWQDEIFRPAMIQSYQLTFSGCLLYTSRCV